VRHTSDPIKEVSRRSLRIEVAPTSKWFTTEDTESTENQGGEKKRAQDP
jgi:hypothetical protein